MDYTVPSRDWAICDTMKFGDRDIPRLTVKGKNIIVINFGKFGATYKNELEQYVAFGCHKAGQGFVTQSWDHVETAARDVYGISIEENIQQNEAMAEEVIKTAPIGTLFRLVGSSVSATVARRVAQRYADRIDLLLLIAPGDDLQKHMIDPHLGKDPAKRLMRLNKPNFEHLLYVPGYPGRKTAHIEWQDLKNTKAYQIEGVQTGMPKTKIVHGVHDRHILPQNSVELCGRIVVGKGDNASPPELILVDAGHDFRTPAELAIIGKILFPEQHLG